MMNIVSTAMEHKNTRGPDFFPGFAYRHKLLKTRPLTQITHIVLHTTGVGLYRWRKRKKHLAHATDTELAKWVYGSIMKSSGHFAVGASGEVTQFVPLDHIAQHCGTGSRPLLTYFGRYFDKNGKTLLTHMPEWWRDYMTRQVKLQQESELMHCLEQAWSKKSCNAVSVGIEVCIPEDRIGPLTAQQSASVSELCSALSIELPSIRWIVSHCLVHPLARTAKGGKPYDMLMHQYEQIKAPQSLLVTKV